MRVTGTAEEVQGQSVSLILVMNIPQASLPTFLSSRGAWL